MAAGTEGSPGGATGSGEGSCSSHVLGEDPACCSPGAPEYGPGGPVEALGGALLKPDVLMTPEGCRYAGKSRLPTEELEDQDGNGGLCCCRCATALLLMFLLNGCSSCCRCAAAGVVDVLLVVLSRPFFLQLSICLCCLSLPLKNHDAPRTCT